MTLLGWVQEEILVGVRHLEEAGGAYRREGRLAPHDQELGRGRTHVDGRGLSRLQHRREVGRGVVEEIHLPAPSRSLLRPVERGGRIAHDGPGPVERGSREPLVPQPQVVAARRPVEQQQHPRVDHAEIGRARNRPQDRATVDADEQRDPRPAPPRARPGDDRARSSAASPRASAAAPPGSRLRPPARSGSRPGRRSGPRA